MPIPSLWSTLPPLVILAEQVVQTPALQELGKVRPISSAALRIVLSAGTCIVEAVP